MNSDSEEFVRLLTEAQGPVYGYLLTLIPDRSRARDLLQETNITLWKKAATFEEGTNFNAWACKIAYFHVLSFRRKMAREKLVFDDDILDYLAERNDDRLIQDFTKDRNAALKACMQKLSDKQRKLVEERYKPGASVQRIAADQGRTVGAISQTLYRIRHNLMQCIEKTLASMQTS
ncbi:MAG: sigma-70 family RNA polymerase sigma factor [Verrucomicrobiota bacterium]|nr:RNA polymerase subunit sigma-70 [Verrucomicrobiales bacterium]MEC7224944.1 sigma-70 family RNA polymerase sigma factor [Verrucomicrobiota bacterium]MEC7637584.1 sigma-70 family RNA polymerase sigma factor [Verrucomicrobiota bacterium]MEC7856622.1 sigma-70 family RNA polymerase sigma factor [Verrucomicrobiota bacterium]MEC8659413.1 sigma-70 family RNA polymerase sigma factor [Verrucomicrobiota bacterium]|tara:strand:+ start:143 stop:670 length:528 start_codon:yes stop_codon:yes gene_type:complete